MAYRRAKVGGGEQNMVGRKHAPILKPKWALLIKKNESQPSTNCLDLINMALDMVSSPLNKYPPNAKSCSREKKKIDIHQKVKSYLRQHN